MGSCQSSPAAQSAAVVTSGKNEGGTSSSGGKKNHQDNSNINQDDSEGRTDISITTRTFSGPNLQEHAQKQHPGKHLDYHNEETEATASADGSDKSSPQTQPSTTTKTGEEIFSSINNNKAKPSSLLVPIKGCGDSGGTTYQMQKRYSRKYDTAVVDGGGEDGSRPRRSIKPGYSSGGSSCSDEHEDAARRHLVDLKNELGADGDLCKGVVHIETDFGRPIEEIYDGVHEGDILGSGVSGEVRRVVHKKTGVNYAVKCLDLGLIQTAEGLQALREEIFIMCQLDHPNIVRLEEVYESESEIYLVQELCHGGDLFDRLDEQSQSDFHFTEAACAKLVKQILSSVRYLHSKKIIHRDLKLENFLFSSADADSDLKMIDFGLSKHFNYGGEVQHESVGTPYTVAPEIIKGNYCETVDVWAIGVISFLLLCGETPFGGIDGENLLCVRNNILKCDLKFEPQEVWEHVSDSGKEFVRRLLNPDPTKRPTAKEAQTDQWLLTYGKRDSSRGVLSPNLAKSLVEFKEYSDMTKVLREVLSFTLLPEQIVDLRKEFEKVDTDGEGEISLCALRDVLIQNAEWGALGALTEDDVRDVFNALRVRKSETKIRWHEFIAAGLSQCNFDERNLKLAFDRLDVDRKGYITYDDLKELLGTSQGDEDGHIEQMWKDGIAECSGPTGQFTYEDFRMFIKGQRKKKRRMSGSPPRSPPGSPLGRRKSVVRLDLDSPGPPSLDVVPEGSVSPQPKHKVFPKFDEISSSLEMPGLPSLPCLGVDEETSQRKDTDTTFPGDLSPRHIRKRSRSFEAPSSALWFDDDLEEEPKRQSYVVLPSRAVGELKQMIEDETKTPLAVNKALYRKHREFRRSVLEGSKILDRARQARRRQSEFQFTEMSQGQRDELLRRASLTMKRGIVPETVPETQAVSDHEEKKSHEEKKVAAAKRSGRRRAKTTSDISGMLR